MSETADLSRGMFDDVSRPNVAELMTFSKTFCTRARSGGLLPSKATMRGSILIISALSSSEMTTTRYCGGTSPWASIDLTSSTSGADGARPLSVMMARQAYASDSEPGGCERRRSRSLGWDGPSERMSGVTVVRTCSCVAAGIRAYEAKSLAYQRDQQE